MRSVWQALSPGALAAALWPVPDMRPVTRDGHSSDPALIATGHTSLSSLLASLPSDLRERLRPTSLRDALRCGVYAKSKREWEPRAPEPWTPYKLLGTAIHADLAQQYYARRATSLQDTTSSANRGTPLVPGALACQVVRQGYQEQDTWTLAKLEKLVQRGVQEALVEGQGVPTGEEVLAVEERLYLGQPDLITALPTGNFLAVTDIKVHWDQKAERYTDEWDTDIQMWAYTDEAERAFGKRVAWRRVLEIILTPKVKATLVPFKTNPERLEFYRPVLRKVTAEVIAAWQWEQLSKPGIYDSGAVLQTSPPVPNTFSCWRYGRCFMYEGCHEFQHDPVKMNVLYKPKETTCPS